MDLLFDYTLVSAFMNLFISSSAHWLLQTLYNDFLALLTVANENQFGCLSHTYISILATF